MSDGEMSGSVAGALNNAAGAPKRLKAMIGEERYDAWLAGLPATKTDLPLTFWFTAWDELKAEFERRHGDSWEYELSVMLEAQS